MEGWVSLEPATWICWDQTQVLNSLSTAVLQFNYCIKNFLHILTNYWGKCKKKISLFLSLTYEVVGHFAGDYVAVQTQREVGHFGGMELRLEINIIKAASQSEGKCTGPCPSTPEEPWVLKRRASTACVK